MANALNNTPEAPNLPRPRTERAAASRPVDWRRAVGRFAAANSTLLVIILLLIVFGLGSQYFLRAGNIFNIWRQMSVVAVLGIGMTLVILIGGIDLSVGAVLFLSAGLTAVLLQDGLPAIVAMAIGLLSGVIAGALNGFLVEIAGISPVIATLGTQIGIRGLTLVAMNNAQVQVTDSFFSNIAIARTPGIAAIALPGLQITVVIVFVLYLITAVFIRQSRFGRHLYAIGGNRRAAYLCGLPVRRIAVMAYVLSGFFAALGGLFMVAAQGVIGPGLGAGLEFYAVAAVVLGGARLSGGVGRLEKTLLGAMVLYMVLNFMTLGHVDTVWQQTATGLLVLAAVVIDRLAQRSQRLGR